MTVYAAVLSGGMEIDRISGTPETVPGSVRPGVLFVQVKKEKKEKRIRI